MSNDEVHERIQDTRGVHDDLFTLVKSGKSGDIILWDGEDNSAGDSERNKNNRKTEEEMGRHQKMDRIRGSRVPGGAIWLSG